MLDDVQRRGRGAGRWSMYFFCAIMIAGLYIYNARPGSMGTQDFSMIVAVAVFSFLGLVDHIRRTR
jgi:hypothetical protein